jgi:hypothetical protein
LDGKKKTAGTPQAKAGSSPPAESCGGLEATVTKQKNYIGVSKTEDDMWQFVVQRANGKVKTVTGFSTAKVAALLRDEYILQHRLDEVRNFTVKRIAKVRNKAYEQMFGRQD